MKVFGGFYDGEILNFIVIQSKAAKSVFVFGVSFVALKHWSHTENKWN